MRIGITRKEAAAGTARRRLGFPIILVIAAIVIFVGLQILRRLGGDAPFSFTQTLTPLTLILLAAVIFVVSSRQRSSLVQSVEGPVIWARATTAELDALFDSKDPTVPPIEVRDIDRTEIAICPVEMPPVILAVPSRTRVESGRPILIPDDVSITLMTAGDKIREVELARNDGRTLRLDAKGSMRHPKFIDLDIQD